ncbi:diacylglycerol kinase family protein [Geobacter sp. DSM 9736]|uniref:diacylglycerol/lipid kinase family protein n=1 Tax=Geobacter sp. DSM 9736 TaxID=1277350 RepID=UPI000B50F215|nr:diacylglycerol kinase family protein [Geobacter sp. DSM 9736]SNB48111.1 Diacylglycerol kinase family enzyme [Geobacter sp. DSM 9736]
MKRACALIANRGAGTFSEARLRQLDLRLREGGVQTQIFLGEHFSEMTSLAREFASTEEAPLVIAAGGDGTVNAVLNGLAGSRATAALLPLGTANVLALELGLKNAEAAVSRIVAGSSRSFTAGTLRCGDRTRRFFLMAGIGVDGAVVQKVSLKVKKVFGKGAYAVAALRHAWEWETEELTVTTPEQTFSCHSLLLCNTARYGGPAILAPEASIFTPTLELIGLRSMSRGAYLRFLATVLRGGVPSSADIVRLRTEKVRINGCKPIQADGDPFGISPVEIETEKDYLSIIV